MQIQQSNRTSFGMALKPLSTKVEAELLSSRYNHGALATLLSDVALKQKSNKAAHIVLDVVGDTNKDSEFIAKVVSTAGDTLKTFSSKTEKGPSIDIGEVIRDANDYATLKGTIADINTLSKKMFAGFFKRG